MVKQKKHLKYYLKKNNISKLFSIMIFSSGITFSQTSINSSGGNINNTQHGTVNYSIGQITTEKINTSQVQIYQGIQVPFYHFSNIKKNINTQSIFVSPIPAQNVIKINITNPNYETCPFSIYDLNGLLIKKGVIKNNIANLNINSLEKGTYIITLNKNSEILINKFIKI